MTVTNCGHRAITMLLILVEVPCLSVHNCKHSHDSHRLQPQTYHTTYSDGSICEVACQSMRLQAYRSTIAATSILLILAEVSVKVACQSTTATDSDCRYRAISMLLIPVEVSLKVAYWSTIPTDCSHRSISIRHVLVEVYVNVACLSTTATDCSIQLPPYYSFLWKYLSKWLVSPQQPQTVATELSTCNLFQWKYLWMFPWPPYYFFWWEYLAC